MSSSGIRLEFLDDERLVPLAVSALPAWLWSSDATRILWANPTGAAVFGAVNSPAINARKFDAGQPAAAQVAHLAAKLAENAPPQTERLRGFGAGVGRALACACSRITRADGSPALLIVATERAGPDLSLQERVSRLFAGYEAPLAVFSPDGKLMHATLAAEGKLGGARSLAALGIVAVATDALRLGHGRGATAYGPIAIKRIGADASTALVVDFAPRESAPAIALPEQAAAAQTGTDALAAPQAVAAVAGAGAQAPASMARSVHPRSAQTPAAGDRRHPLRFVWQMDLANRFTLESDEFIALIGPRTAAAIGLPWQDIAAELELDPDGRVAQAVGTRNTWSGIAVNWPADGNAERLTVEMSGLPIFDRERAFRGYRGFGVCRELGRLSHLARSRRRATDVASGAAVPAASSRPPLAKMPPARPDPPRAESSTPALSPLEHRAFRELSRRLAQRLNQGNEEPAEFEQDMSDRDDSNAFAATAHDVRTMFDRLPIGVLIYRLDELIYANAAFLHAVGHSSLHELAGAGGLDSLLVTPTGEKADEAAGEPVALTIERGDKGRLDAELIRIDWEGEMAHALVTTSPVDAPMTLGADAAALQAEIADLRSVLDTATDGVLMLDRSAKVLSANRSAEALFGYEAKELAGLSLFDLLAAESHDLVATYFDSLREDAVANILNSAREVIGRVSGGGLIPLFVTLGTVGDSKDKLCAVFRDLTPWKKTEEELIAAKRQAEKVSSAKSDFLAKISHEIRTPLNAIIGFSEVMMEERFGRIGNERYRDYLKDIHVSGGHLLSLINDLLDLSKIEAGKLDLSFANVSLNDLTQQCVAIMQPQANRDRVIIRSALAPKLPQVVADARSVRQIVLNLLANSIKFTGAGGQVIVSTALKDDGAVALRVRDTGIGMSEKDIATALEPFRQVATSGRAGGTGLGLPLTKALAEANQARFAIKSAPKEGTLVEVTFPASQVLVG
jgi:PAS domain S-box-containing protein